jgi:hypothetical protein
MYSDVDSKRGRAAQQVPGALCRIFVSSHALHPAWSFMSAQQTVLGTHRLLLKCRRVVLTDGRTMLLIELLLLPQACCSCQALHMAELSRKDVPQEAHVVWSLITPYHANCCSDR